MLLISLFLAIGISTIFELTMTLIELSELTFKPKEFVF